MWRERGVVVSCGLKVVEHGVQLLELNDLRAARVPVHRAADAFPWVARLLEAALQRRQGQGRLHRGAAHKHGRVQHVQRSSFAEQRIGVQGPGRVVLHLRWHTANQQAPAQAALLHPARRLCELLLVLLEGR